MIVTVLEGRHSRDLDKALQVHTPMAYPAIFSRQRQQFQLQIKNVDGAEDSDFCECGQRERVKHVLLDSRRLRQRDIRVERNSEGQKLRGRYAILIVGMVGRKGFCSKMEQLYTVTTRSGQSSCTPFYSIPPGV